METMSDFASLQSVPVKSASGQLNDHDAQFDHYDNRKAEVAYLKSKPNCFIILGKPCSGKLTLAKKLSAHWNAELINGP